MFTLYISTIYDDPDVIEVEVIHVVRQKYTMLQSTIPITLLQNDPIVQLTALAKWFVYRLFGQNQFYHIINTYIRNKIINMSSHTNDSVNDNLLKNIINLSIIIS